jgi:lipopolysaccharide/colanic/teichoic acid biosynthesis glycosyltransferase
MYRRVFKRLFDVVAALAGLVVTLPVTLTLAIALAVANGGSPLFLQRRPGRGGKIFIMVKFRTMSDARDGSGALLPDHERTHRLGRLVRRTSMDELPQMLNVLAGQMSFVGPRPLLERYLPLYDSTRARRHEVKPGITGWAQVNGRNSIGWDKRLSLDVWYVDHVSLSLDARIVVKTIVSVVRRRGIDADAKTTMIPFDEWMIS